MITVTKNAATQIAFSAEQGKMQSFTLRIAIKCQDNGSFHYMMGFDEQREGDQKFEIEGVNIVLDKETQTLANGMMLDYAEIENKMEFIFLNPNDPAYKQPIE